MSASSQPAARQRRRIPLVPFVIAAAFTVGLFGASTLSAAFSSHSISWQPAAGIGGPRFDAAAAQTTTVVHVEVQWPACVSIGDHSWLAPDVSYMPWSVTITIRTTASFANNPKCSGPGSDGGLPVVGTYLSALSFPVQLREPLGGRPIFDGSAFPAVERVYGR